MTPQELTRTLKRWQKRIRLIAAWNISIRFATPEELATPIWENTYGILMYCDESNTTADIIIRHPDYYGDLRWYSVDETVLHELGHIIVDHHKRETALNGIAEAMYGMRRQRKTNVT